MRTVSGMFPRNHGDVAIAALLVPSGIVRQERNYVLNVRHSQFARLEIGRPEPFSFDERLWDR